MISTIPRSPYLHVDDNQGIFRVARRALIDEALFEHEKSAIFDTCWLYVGHESELTMPGKFHVRFAGGREIILNRDMSGTVNAFLNTCPHRGARLCTEQAGVAKSFYCYYHGWTFASEGGLRVLPDRESSFAPGFNRDGSADLVRVPRLESYRGLYFVCFDANTIPLADYLGRARSFIDDALDQGSDGMEIVPGTQEYAVKANWKLCAENGVDGNHPAALHASYFDYVKASTPGLAPAARPNAAGPTPKGGSPVPGGTYDLGNGHVVLEYAVPWGRVAGKWSPAFGADTKADIEETLRRNSERLGVERAERLANMSRNLLIFPNLHLIDATGLTLRVSHPDTVDSTYMSSYALGARGESERVRALRLAHFVEFLGPGGLVSPDDIEAMEQCQRSYRKNAAFAPWNDVSKGSVNSVDGGRLDEEGNIRILWLEWARRIGEATLTGASRVWR
jgi:p-cumate 2,3-dioxygenase alpha subunit